MAMTLDIGGTLLRRKAEQSHKFSDYEAMLSDWVITGNDLRTAIQDYDEQIDQSSAR